MYVQVRKIIDERYNRQSCTIQEKRRGEKNRGEKSRGEKSRGEERRDELR